jgi:PAS domain S-box-containing protein
LGRSPRQLLGTPIVELLHPDDHATLAQLDADSAEGGSVTRTHRVVHADGLVRWMTTTTQYHLGGVHGGIEVLTVGRDVTDVVGLRDALVDSEERFRRAFDDAPIGMAITTFSGQFVRVNRAFAAMLGHEPEAMMAMTVVDLTPVQYRALDATNLAALSAGHEQVQDVDKEYLHRNGSRVPVQVRAATMEGPPGRPALIIAHVSPRQS